jgi:uncharacterized damage-inducible protein DinB
MGLADNLLPEFDHEMQTTRRILERVPDGKFDWQPHPKSMRLGRLASHVAELVTWGTMTMKTDELDIAPPGEPPPVAANYATRAEILAAFDANSKAARAAIAGAADPELMRPWSLKHSGRTAFTMPKIAVLRSMVMNHLIHHRAQLGVFLRLNDVELPGSYGPSADESAL